MKMMLVEEVHKVIRFRYQKGKTLVDLFKNPIIDHVVQQNLLAMRLRVFSVSFDYHILSLYHIDLIFLMN